ncbi:polyadenylate-binding protein [Citrus sinensis]|nr:polyadenylate-binding protein [Citrus sinensis]
MSGRNGEAAGASGNQLLVTSLYVGDLDFSVIDSQLYDLFSLVGQVMSVTIYAARALDVLNFTPLNNKSIRITCSHGDPSIQESGPATILIENLDKFHIFPTFSSCGNILSCEIATDAGKGNCTNKTKFNNIFVKNLTESTTDEDLKKIFGEYGTITSAVVMRDGDGKSKCFGFVNFENADDAAKTVDALNRDREWYQAMKETVYKFQGLDLYIKNLNDSINDEKLEELGCVMRDLSGIRKGAGFVVFSTPEEATRDLAEMNSKMIVSKPLYVVFAYFSQMRTVAIAPSVPPRMPMYPHGAPGIGQQFLYGQQQLVLGMSPGGAPMPNFFVPVVLQGQQDQCLGGRRGAGPVQQTQQPLPMTQQQMLPRAHVYRCPLGRNMQDVPMQGVAGCMLPIPFDMGAGMPRRDASVRQPTPITPLSTALANASPEQRRTLPGESLYPLIEQLERDAAAEKVTGMLLEMHQTEVLHLLESPEALKAKVAEAMEVLRSVAQQQANNPADQLASLSLNDNLFFLSILRSLNKFGLVVVSNN